LFTLGDHQPNTNEIHIDFIEKKEIFKDYITDCEKFKVQSLKVSKFCEIWKECFSHVKIRRMKGISGMFIISK
jgi:hypothetical protein